MLADLLPRLPQFLEFLRESERWPREALAAYRENMLTKLVAHAYEHSPFYRDRLAPLYRRGRGPRLHRWRDVPILTRADLLNGTEHMDCTSVPPDHGKPFRVRSSGSTGRPVEIKTTWLAHLAFLAATCRDHERHARDRNLTLASIRAFQKPGADGASYEQWGATAKFLGFTGRSHILDSGTTLADTIAWLHRVEPAYLNIYPSSLRALVGHLDDNPDDHFPLRGIMSMSEPLDDDLRDKCLARWGVEVADRYGTREAGTVAMQCPTGRHFHIDAELVMVEIITESGEPARPGEMGRVLITPYYNYATPLLRYDIGDYAIAGKPCGCGRTLPVIGRVFGRERNMFHRPDGSIYWPTVGSSRMMKIYTFRQYQVAQTAIDAAELRVVADADPTDDQLREMEALFADKLHRPLTLSIRRVDRLERNAGGKFEDYVCELETPAVASDRGA